MQEKIKKIYCTIVSSASIQMIFVVCLLVLCVYEIHAITTDVRSIRFENGNYSIRQSWRALHTQDSLAPNDIESWMTFAFVNTIFKLPTTFLETTLGIHDSRYPNISLSRYARKNNQTINEFTQSVRNAVSLYLSK